MGYTHYLRRARELHPDGFKAWSADVRRIIENLPERTNTAGGYYSFDPLKLCRYLTVPDPKCGVLQEVGEPETTDEIVCFNGSGETESGERLYHETFVVERVYEPDSWQNPDENGFFFTFCKTARKPYDLAVTAALIRLAYHFPEGVALGSDGWADEWEAGLQLVRDLFGFAVLPPEIDQRPVEEVS